MSRRSLFEDLSEARAGAIRDDAGWAVWLGSAAELAPSINAADDPQLANLIGGSTESTRPGHFQIRLCPGETSPSPALRLLGLAVHFVNQGVKGRHL